MTFLQTTNENVHSDWFKWMPPNYCANCIYIYLCSFATPFNHRALLPSECGVFWNAHWPVALPQRRSSLSAMGLWAFWQSGVPCGEAIWMGFVLMMRPLSSIRLGGWCLRRMICIASPLISRPSGHPNANAFTAQSSVRQRFEWNVFDGPSISSLTSFCRLVRLAPTRPALMVQSVSSSAKRN